MAYSRGRIEVIQITFKSSSRGGPGIGTPSILGVEYTHIGGFASAGGRSASRPGPYAQAAPESGKQCRDTRPNKNQFTSNGPDTEHSTLCCVPAAGPAQNTAQSAVFRVAGRPEHFFAAEPLLHNPAYIRIINLRYILMSHIY